MSLIGSHDAYTSWSSTSVANPGQSYNSAKTTPYIPPVVPPPVITNPTNQTTTTLDHTFIDDIVRKNQQNIYESSTALNHFIGPVRFNELKFHNGQAGYKDLKDKFEEVEEEINTALQQIGVNDGNITSLQNLTQTITTVSFLGVMNLGSPVINVINTLRAGSFLLQKTDNTYINVKDVLDQLQSGIGTLEEKTAKINQDYVNGNPTWLDIKSPQTRIYNETYVDDLKLKTGPAGSWESQAEKITGIVDVLETINNGLGTVNTEVDELKEDTKFIKQNYYSNGVSKLEITAEQTRIDNKTFIKDLYIYNYEEGYYEDLINSRLPALWMTRAEVGAELGFERTFHANERSQLNTTIRDYINTRITENNLGFTHVNLNGGGSALLQDMVNVATSSLNASISNALTVAREARDELLASLNLNKDDKSANANSLVRYAQYVDWAGSPKPFAYVDTEGRIDSGYLFDNDKFPEYAYGVDDDYKTYPLLQGLVPSFPENIWLDIVKKGWSGTATDAEGLIPNLFYSAPNSSSSNWRSHHDRIGSLTKYTGIDPTHEGLMYIEKGNFWIWSFRDGRNYKMVGFELDYYSGLSGAFHRSSGSTGVSSRIKSLIGEGEYDRVITPSQADFAEVISGLWENSSPANFSGGTKDYRTEVGISFNYDETIPDIEFNKYKLSATGDWTIHTDEATLANITTNTTEIANNKAMIEEVLEVTDASIGNVMLDVLNLVEGVKNFEKLVVSLDGSQETIGLFKSTTSDCSVRIEGKGEAYLEIANTANSGSTTKSWGIGTNDNDKLEFNWKPFGTTMNATQNVMTMTNNGKVGIKLGHNVAPTEELDVNGTVKATKFLGDGSELSIPDIVTNTGNITDLQNITQDITRNTFLGTTSLNINSRVMMLNNDLRAKKLLFKNHTTGSYHSVEDAITNLTDTLNARVPVTDGNSGKWLSSDYTFKEINIPEFDTTTIDANILDLQMFASSLQTQINTFDVNADLPNIPKPTQANKFVITSMVGANGSLSYITPTTSLIDEGSNLYFTNTRCNNAIAVKVGDGSIANAVIGALSAQTVTAQSDIRLKENIKRISNTDALSALEPVTYNFKSDETQRTRYGLIAQDVEETLPELVVTDDKTGIKGINYIDIIALLVKQNQELATRVTKLENLFKKVNPKTLL